MNTFDSFISNQTKLNSSTFCGVKNRRCIIRHSFIMSCFYSLIRENIHKKLLAYRPAVFILGILFLFS